MKNVIYLGYYSFVKSSIASIETGYLFCKIDVFSVNSKTIFLS